MFTHWPVVMEEITDYIIFTVLGAAINSVSMQLKTSSVHQCKLSTSNTAMPIPLVTMGIQGVISAAVHCQGGTSRTSTVSKPDGMLPGLAL